MDKVLTTIDTLKDQLEAAQKGIEHGTLPCRLIGFSIRGISHVRRTIVRVKNMKKIPTRIKVDKPVKDKIDLPVKKEDKEK